MPPNAKIFEEILDPEFSPSNELVMQYAFYLGMSLGIDPEQNQFLLEYAEQGLKEKIPEGWSPMLTEEGDLIYFNHFDNSFL